MSAIQIVLFIHVVAAIALVGGSFSAQVSALLLSRATTVDAGRAHVTWMATFVRVAGPLAGVVLLAGLYLTFSMELWARGWPVVSLVLFTMGGIAAPTIIDPGVRRLAERLDALPPGPIGPAAIARVLDARLTIAGWLLAGADVAIVALMTTKPGWAVSIAVGVAGLGLGALIGTARHRRLSTTAGTDDAVPPGIPA